ncbi:phage tail fiber protein [Desulfovibrio caledoniensis]
MAIMQITDDKSEIRYTATEGQTEFVFDFPVYMASHMTVYEGVAGPDGAIAWTVKEEGSDWTLEHTDDEARTGKVVFNAGRAAGSKILMQRVVPLTQLSRYIDDDRLPAEVFETDINLGIMIDQQHRRALSKCFKLADTSALADLMVPEPEAGKVLYWVSTDELGNRDLTDFGMVVLPLSIGQGGTGAETPEEALEALGAEPADAALLKADRPGLLRAAYGDDVQIHSGPDLSGLDVARNHVAWTLTGASLFSDVSLPYDGTYVFHIYPGGNALSLAASYKSDGSLPSPRPDAGEIRIAVEQYNARKTIVSLQNVEV